MPPEISIPSQFEFKELVSHTFPGFFLALSVFMLLDVLSPKDLTPWAFGTLTNFLSAMGFIILLGTILGILIDGIQHMVEEKIFEACQEFKKLKEEEQENLYPLPGIKHFLYFKRIGGKDTFDYLTDNYYRYAEFYGNIAISLIPFSLISPFYFCYVLKISYFGSFIFGFVAPLALACLCIWNSYKAFFKYHCHRRDMIYGYGSLGITKSIEVTADPKSIPAGSRKCSNITAQLKWKAGDLEEQKAFQKGVQIDFTTNRPDIDYLIPKQKKTDENGKATVQLRSDDITGLAIVTASSKGFNSGNVKVLILEKL